MKSALKDFFRGKVVVSEGGGTVDTPTGPVETQIASVEPYSQTIMLLTDDQLAGIAQQASSVRDFIVSAGVEVGESWTLEHLDAAFIVWTCAPRTNRLPEHAVVGIIGSAFGQYCVDHLEMEWVQVQDEDVETSDYAVRSYKDGKEVMAFPYSAVLKRVEDNEHTFLVPMFYAIKHAINESDHADRSAH